MPAIIEVARHLRHNDVLPCLTALFGQHGSPAYLRSDNGSEFTAKAVRHWLARVDVQTLFIEPGSPLGEWVCGKFDWEIA